MYKACVLYNVRVILATNGFDTTADFVTQIRESFDSSVSKMCSNS